jgi:hypothetical protein
MLHAGFDAGLQSDSAAFGMHVGLAAVIAMTDDGDDQVKDSNDV